MAAAAGNENASPSDGRHVVEYTFERFVRDCGAGLTAMGLPQRLWPTLFEKLATQRFDAGNTFGFTEIDEDSEDGALALATLCDVSTDDNDAVWICDHAWTFTPYTALQQLRADAELRLRVGSMMFGRGAATRHAEHVDWILEQISENLYKRARHYVVRGSESGSPSDVWYLADEVGTAVLPTAEIDGGNVAIAPLYFPPLRGTFDVMWPLHDIEGGHLVTYCVCRGVTESKRRSHPRYAKVWAGGDEEDEMDSICSAKDRMKQIEVEERNAAAPKVLLDHASRVDTRASAVAVSALKRVFTDEASLRAELQKGDEFIVVGDISDADIVLLSKKMPLQMITAVAPNAAFVSQFAADDRLLRVGHRAAAVARHLGQPPWMPLTFDPDAQADLFVGYVINARAAGSEEVRDAWCVHHPDSDGAWSVNYVTANDDLLLRCAELIPAVLTKAPTNRLAGDDGRVLSLRCFVLVKSWSPVIAYSVNKLWVMTAAKPVDVTKECDCDLGALMADRYAPWSDDELGLWVDGRFGTATWTKVMADVRAALFEVFAATDLEYGGEMSRPPKVGCKTQSRAVYAVDFALLTNLTKDALHVELEGISFTGTSWQRQIADQPQFLTSVLRVLFGTDEGRPADRRVFCTRLLHRVDADAPLASASPVD